MLLPYHVTYDTVDCLHRDKVSATGSTMATSEESGSNPKELSQEKFAANLINIIDNAALSMAMGVGAALGLFSVMAELDQPESSDVIAKRAGLIERYVREWLAVLVTGKIIFYDRDSKKYFLPRNYIPFLVSGKNNIPVLSQMMLMMGETYEELFNCFKHGGGIPYSSYKSFYSCQSELSWKRYEEEVVQHFVPSIEGLKEKLESGIKCADIACGSGHASIYLGAAFPKSEFYGFDFSFEAINRAKDEAMKNGLKNCHFNIQDCANLDAEFQDSFDYVTAFDSIHDQAYPDKVLHEINKILKKGGLFSLYDVFAHSDVADNIGLPLQPLNYAASLFHCMPVSLYFEGGKGLGTCWGKELAIKMLENAGFSDIKEIPIPNNPYNMHFISKKE